jgi:hypothetical protein
MFTIVYRPNFFLNIPIPCYIFIKQMSLFVVGGRWGYLRIISCFLYLSFDIYNIIMTSCQAFYCTNEKGKCEKNFFYFVITGQNYPCQHIYQWPRKTRKVRQNGQDKSENGLCLLSPPHWTVLKNGDPHYLVLHAISMTKFYLTVFYF